MANMKQGRRPRGMALISALMVLVIMGIIAGCFAMVMNRDARQSRISSYQLICLNAAQAGIDYAIYLHKHNLALYPMVDYTLANSADNELRFPGYANSEQYTYPMQGTIYDLPSARLKDSSNVAYSPVGDRQHTYINGSSTQTFDTEYMFVNDLSFWTNPNNTYANHSNFMHGTRFCVTYQIREQVSFNGYKAVLSLVSTGKLRYVPDGYDWTSESAWTNYAAGFSSPASAAQSSQWLDQHGFTEFASRTVAVNLDFERNDSSTYHGDPPKGTLLLDSTQPVVRQLGPKEADWREWFR